jgi:hypothetical protein
MLPFLPDGFFINLNGGSGRTNRDLPRNLEPLNLVAKQASIPSAVKYVDKNSFVGGPAMKTKVKKRVKGAPRKLGPHGTQIGQNQQRRYHHPPNGH